MTTEEKFFAALNVINSLNKDGPFQPSKDLISKLYAYEQQATVGPCNTSKPLFFGLERQKWNAWKELGCMSKEIAMVKYVEELSKVIETMSYTESVSDFMDIMPSFYEMVWDNEIDCNDLINADLEAKDQNAADVKNQDVTVKNHSSQFTNNEPARFASQNRVVSSQECIQYQYYKENWIASPSKIKFFVNGYEETLGKNIVDIYEPESLMCPESDKLVSSVLHLQKSLDSIVQQLSSLENMAETYRNQLQKISEKKDMERNWTSSLLTVAVLSSPFVAYWLLYLFRHRKKPLQLG